MITLKLTEIGDSTGLVLPEEILGRLGAKRGDTLMVLETKNGIELRTFDPGFARQIEIAERVMEKERSVLKRLARS
jgi:putative addiction module antidote